MDRVKSTIFVIIEIVIVTVELVWMITVGENALRTGMEMARVWMLKLGEIGLGLGATEGNGGGVVGTGGVLGGVEGA